MRAMKDSGVAWIGEIPAEWDRVKFKYLHNGLNTGESIDKDYWSTDEKDDVFYTAGLTPIRTTYKDFPPWKYTQKNDILLARNGTPYVYFPVEGACYSDHIIRASVKNSINRKFVQYALQQSIASVVVDSVSIATWSASLWDEQIIPWPNKNEQQRIVIFLDKECAYIDAVIEQTRASIEEYKKLKQAVITQAVAKGIRPNRPMKDSGVEWIGEIPENWTCVKFKYIATVKSNLVSPDNYGNYPQISPENIEKGSGRLLPYKTVSEVGVISGNHLFYKGQILYSKIRPILNKVCIAPFDGLCSADMYPIETTINKYYLLYALRADSFLANIKLITEDRVKMPKINQEELGEILFAVPSMDEQEEIVTYINKKNIEIDILMQQKNELLDELEKYKKSLIFEYVTGKKKVNG